MNQLTHATRTEGVCYSLIKFSVLFTIGAACCMTIVGAIIGIPLIILSLWALAVSPWFYRKLSAGSCPVCGARCVFAPKVRARKCPECKTRLIVKGEELCKVVA